MAGLTAQRNGGIRGRDEEAGDPAHHVLLRPIDRRRHEPDGTATQRLGLGFDRLQSPFMSLRQFLEHPQRLKRAGLALAARKAAGGAQCS